MEKLFENDSFPSSTDDACGGFYRTEFWTLSHTGLGSTLYTMYRFRVTYLDVTMLPHSSSILTTTVSGLHFQAAR